MVHAGWDHRRAAGADHPGVRRNRLDRGHTARRDGRRSAGRVLRPFRQRRLGCRRARQRQHGPNEGILNAVLDFSTTNAWAFADFSVLHWNGSAWSAVSGALPALAVSADGPDDIWGIYRDDQVTHYNGTSRSTYTLSGPSGTAFESVAALSPTDVWAGGTNGTGPLLEHFNGTSWQVMTTPSSFSGAGVLAMTAKSDSDVWIFSVHNPLTAAVLLANFFRLMVPSIFHLAEVNQKLLHIANLNRQWDATEINKTYIEIIKTRLNSQNKKLDQWFISK